MQTVGEIVLDELREFRRETGEHLDKLEVRIRYLETFRVKVVSVAAASGAVLTGLLSYFPDWFNLVRGH